MEPTRRQVIYPIGYMFGVTFVFCAVLIGVAALTRDRVEANRQVLFEKAVLMAVGLPVDESTSPAETHRLFVDVMEPPAADTGGAYRLKQADGTSAYALPFEGRGFWNVIRGVVGISADGRTLVGIAFHEQSETPGLGAEIVKPAFCDQFKGRAIREGERPILLKTAGMERTEGDLHAVTGATQTCVRLEAMLNRAIREWCETRKAVSG